PHNHTHDRTLRHQFQRFRGVIARRIINPRWDSCARCGKTVSPWRRQKPTFIAWVPMQDDLASFDLTLSADQSKTLEEASRIELGFPHDLYAKGMVRTFVYGGLRDQILVEPIVPVD